MHVDQSMWELLATEIENSGFFTKAIVWKRAVQSLNRYQEDPIKYVDVPLHMLSNYNYMRSWPITVATESGEIDRQSIQLIFLIKEFKDLGLVNAQGYPLVDPGLDRFEFDGFVHKCVGDTNVSQIGTRDLLFTLIVKREEAPTGTFR